MSVIVDLRSKEKKAEDKVKADNDRVLMTLRNSMIEIEVFSMQVPDGEYNLRSSEETLLFMSKDMEWIHQYLNDGKPITKFRSFNTRFIDTIKYKNE